MNTLYTLTELSGLLPVTSLLCLHLLLLGLLLVLLEPAIWLFIVTVSIRGFAAATRSHPVADWAYGNQWL
jgi:hypothetical protein